MVRAATRTGAVQDVPAGRPDEDARGRAMPRVRLFSHNGEWWIVAFSDTDWVVMPLREFLERAAGIAVPRCAEERCRGL